MPVAPHEPEAGDVKGERFVVHAFEYFNWESVRDGIQSLGIQIVNAPPVDFLQRLNAELAKNRLEARPRK